MSSKAIDIQAQRDIETLWKVYSLTVEDTAIRVVPDAGCNVGSIMVGGQEFLRQSPTLIEQPGTKYGVPILYPTPNRVRDGLFTFEGRRYRFTPNHGPNFIHGLAHNAPWTVVEARELFDRRGNVEPACELECELPFRPGLPRYDLFPHPHVLRLVIRISPRKVRWTYTVDNSLGTTPRSVRLWHPYLVSISRIPFIDLFDTPRDALDGGDRPPSDWQARECRGYSL